MEQMFRLAGVTFEGRQSLIAGLSTYDEIYMERDYFNRYDRNAIGVYTKSGLSIGWIPKEIARRLAPKLDDGDKYEIRINRILGGNGLSYGIEVILREIGSQPDFKQKIVDMINNQTLTHSETALNLINQSIREQHEQYILDRNVEEIIRLIQNGWLSLENIKDFANFCFRRGRFEDCFMALITLEELSDYYEDYELGEFCQDNLRVFYSYGYESPLPKPTKYYFQSEENDDETYPDLAHVYDAVNNNTIDILLDSLHEDLEKGSNESKSAALFALGELHYLKQDNQKAIELYIHAIRENPNKALYWGYTAQVMNWNNVHPLISSRFLQRALELDSMNPRWHFLQSILLLAISNQEEIQDLIQQAVDAANHALELCRPGQAGLRRAIFVLLGEE